MDQELDTVMTPEIELKESILNTHHEPRSEQPTYADRDSIIAHFSRAADVVKQNYLSSPDRDELSLQNALTEAERVARAISLGNVNLRTKEMDDAQAVAMKDFSSEARERYLKSVKSKVAAEQEHRKTETALSKAFNKSLRDIHRAERGVEQETSFFGTVFRKLGFSPA